ncbi:GumC family protein, partial [Allocoleopsis sp.]|uniref:GumC family protein n=1 Tax=Allocoleopsis sp. TaxID=3088169 RepID=UPI002FCFB4AB
GGNLPELRSRSDIQELEAGDGNTLDLAWLFAVVRRRAPITAAAAIILAGISGGYIIWQARKIPPTFKGSFSVLVEPITAEGRLAKLSLSAQTGVNTGAADVSRLGIENSDLMDYETQIRVLRSPKLMEPIIKELQVRYPDVSYNSLMEQLEIVRVSYEKDGKQQGTKILNISYFDRDANKIKYILEQLAKIYLNYSVDERVNSLRQGVQYIDDQLPDLQKRVDNLQGQLQKLRQQYTLNEPEATGKSLTEQAQNLKSQRIDIQAQLAQAKAAFSTRQRQLIRGETTSVLTSETNQVGAYERLIGELQKVEADIALQSARFREDSPTIVDLREKQRNLRAVLAQEAQKSLDNVASKIRELEARDRSLAEAESQINEKIKVFPAVIRQYTDLQRELQVATDSLKQFLEKRETLQLDASQRKTPWQIIAAPEMPRDKFGKPIPASAKKTKRQLAIAGVLSLLMGVGIGFVVEILHTVFHTPEEIKAATRLRLLGVIPFARKLKKLDGKTPKLAPAFMEEVSSHALLPLAAQAHDQRSAAFQEAFRSLYTNIRLLSARSPIHSLVIGSAVPGDGKSTVAIHLAQTAASIGQRVLLIDADLRRPQLHVRLGLPNEQGLSDVITTDLSLNDAIVRSSVEENLFVLTAGQPTSDSIKLLSSAKMQYLMEQFQAFFDLVIYDTPPLLGLADGNILAANTDGIVLVVGLQKTDRSLLTKSLDGLKISGASVLGVVANGIKGYMPDSYMSYHRQYQTIER